MGKGWGIVYGWAKAWVSKILPYVGQGLFTRLEAAAYLAVCGHLSVMLSQFGKSKPDLDLSHTS